MCRQDKMCLLRDEQTALKIYAGSLKCLCLCLEQGCVKHHAVTYDILFVTLEHS